MNAADVLLQHYVHPATDLRRCGRKPLGQIVNFPDEIIWTFTFYPEWQVSLFQRLRTHSFMPLPCGSPSCAPLCRRYWSLPETFNGQLSALQVSCLGGITRHRLQSRPACILVGLSWQNLLPGMYAGGSLDSIPLPHLPNITTCSPHASTEIPGSSHQKSLVSMKWAR